MITYYCTIYYYLGIVDPVAKTRKVSELAQKFNGRLQFSTLENKVFSEDEFPFAFLLFEDKEKFLPFFEEAKRLDQMKCIKYGPLSDPPKII